MIAITDRIKLRHLQVFLEIARVESVGKAAVSLNISQPAVSKTLKDLEDELGVKLFERVGRSVVLSRFGKVFRRYAGSSYTSLKQGVESIAQLKSQGGFTVSIGALPTVSSGILPKAALRFKQDSPAVILRVVNGENKVLLDQLLRGDLDIVVGRAQPPEEISGLSFEHIYSEAIGFFVRPGHPLLLKKTVNTTQISDHLVLYPGDNTVIRPMVDRFLMAAGIGGLSNRIETVSVPFARSLVRQSDAIWVISKGAVIEDINLGLIVQLPLDTGSTAGSVGITMRADAPVSLAAQLLCQAIRDVAGEKS